MIITLNSEFEQALILAAFQQGTTPEAIVQQGIGLRFYQRAQVRVSEVLTL